MTENGVVWTESIMHVDSTIYYVTVLMLLALMANVNSYMGHITSCSIGCPALNAPVTLWQEWWMGSDATFSLLAEKWRKHGCILNNSEKRCIGHDVMYIIRQCLVKWKHSRKKNSVLSEMKESSCRDIRCMHRSQSVPPKYNSKNWLLFVISHSLSWSTLYERDSSLRN